MTKRPFPYSDATLDECIAKRARLSEKMQAVTARMRVLEPPKEAETRNGPPCTECSTLSVLRVSRSVKNPGREFWSCPAHGWMGWADTPEKNPMMVATCKACQHSRKLGAKGEVIPAHVKKAIEDGTYECERCVEDGKF